MRRHIPQHTMNASRTPNPHAAHARSVISLFLLSCSKQKLSISTEYPPLLFMSRQYIRIRFVRHNFIRITCMPRPPGSDSRVEIKIKNNRLRTYLK